MALFTYRTILASFFYYFVTGTCWWTGTNKITVWTFSILNASQFHATSWKLPHSSTLHIHLTALFTGLPGWAGTSKVKPIWILLKQETASGSGISWTICKSATCSRQTTTPEPHRSVFYRPDALPATQPTVSKHWSSTLMVVNILKYATLLTPSHYILWERQHPNTM